MRMEQILFISLADAVQRQNGLRTANTSCSTRTNTVGGPSLLRARTAPGRTHSARTALTDELLHGPPTANGFTSLLIAAAGGRSGKHRILAMKLSRLRTMVAAMPRNPAMASLSTIKKCE